LMLDTSRQITPSHPAERKEPIPALTGLRFIAAFGVMWGHWISSVQNAPAAVAATWHWASFSMTLFFTLSGFVIHYNYAEVIQRPGGIAAFAIARFARLYPLYILVFAIELAAYSQNPNRYLFATIISFVTMTQGWLPIYAVFHPLAGEETQPLVGAMFGLSLSLSVEVLLYFLYVPASLYLFSRLRSQRATVIAMAAHCAVFSAIFLRVVLARNRRPLVAVQLPLRSRT
jgi:peptidoglycan/LPS O-acetylase OafA/YrhL